MNRYRLHEPRPKREEVLYRFRIRAGYPHDPEDREIEIIREIVPEMTYEFRRCFHSSTSRLSKYGYITRPGLEHSYEQI